MMGDFDQYFVEIKRWLDEKGCVTYRALACSLKISVGISKCALYKYVEQKDNKIRSTVLSIKKAGSPLFSFQFVDANDFDGLSKLLENSQYKEVYALHTTDSSKHTKLAVQGLDHCQVEEAIRGSSTLAAFTTNCTGNVHLSGVKTDVRRVRSASKVTPSQNVKLSNKPRANISTKVSTDTISAAVNDAAEKEKLANKASFFFGSAMKTSTKNEYVDKEIATDRKEKILEEVKKPVVEEEWDEESDDENDSKPNRKNVPDKAKIKKRRIAVNAPKGSGGVHQSDVILTKNEASGSSSEDNSDDEDNIKKKRSKKKAKERSLEINVKKHGAMDDFIEDATLREKEKHDGVVPKRKRKKLVEKMFADEKGYLVTEMVMEEVTDDEADDPKDHIASSSKRNEKHATVASSVPAKKAKVTSTSKKGSTKSNAQQKSMMSFFSKK